MAMSKPVENPKEGLHTRMTRVETRLDTILQFVATKEDLAKLEGRMNAKFADQMKYALGILGILLSAIAVATTVATTVILRALQ